MHDCVTTFRSSHGLSAVEVAHALAVLRHVHPDLQGWVGPDLGLVRRLAERCGVRDGAVRTALSRACSSGTLEVTGGRYRLGPISIEQARAARSLLARVDGYLVVVIHEGEQLDLRAVRDVLTRHGFRAFQRSVWIGARTADDRLAPALQRLGIPASVTVFPCDEIDPGAQVRLGAAWGLEDRRATLRAFHRDLKKFLHDDRADAVEVAWRCVEASPVWYRIAVLDEPPFPLSLCDADHPLEQLNADWSTALRRATPALVEQLLVTS
jgi:DNA-binding transcriptional regulator PaaX